MSDTKPGYQTTEFWGALATTVANLLTMLAILGKIKPEDVGPLTAAVTQICGGLGVLVANAAIIATYITSRTAVKKLEANRPQ